MYRFHRSPLLVFFVLLALFALACQAISLGQSQSTPVAPAAQQALVDQAVATIMAQLPETAGNAAGVAVVPVSTDMEATLIALYERVNPSVVHIFVLDDQGLSLIHI